MKLFFELLGEITAVVKSIFRSNLGDRLTRIDQVLAGRVQTGVIYIIAGSNPEDFFEIPVEL